MSTTPAHYIANNTIVPVSNVEKGSNEPAPGFFSAYEAANTYKEKSGDSKQKGSHTHSDEARKDSQSETIDNRWPEIFKLLTKYSFKDLLQLSVGNSDSELKRIIRMGRRSRGVSQFVPVSSTHGQHNSFIRHAAQQYFSTRNLMQNTASQTYRGVI